MNELKKGFSLIEIMIVVVIIGILATLAYPRLERYILSSRQTEAKTNLMAVYTAQKIFFASNNRYASQLNELGVQLEEGEGAVYQYSITSDGTSFLVTAQGNLDDDATLDVWTIDESKNLQNSTNDIIN